MPELATPADDSDEAFLDGVFERAVAQLEDGASVSVTELLGGHERLRREVELLLADARATVCLRGERLPEVPGYTLIEELGRGGMGAVYLARQESLGGRRVALKVLPASAAGSDTARRRFLAEAQALAKVRHPHVVTVHDVIDSPLISAYAMEWVDGLSLAQCIEKVRAATVAGKPPELSALRGALELPGARASETHAVFVCRTGIAIARALGALHRAELVHRDVKPSNVLLRRDGTALLSDFGLVHSSDGALTKSGEFVGTVLYAPPEQLEGEPESLDARSDVYALGVTLYHALTLHLPFDDRSADSKRATTPTGMLRMMSSRPATPLRSWDASLPRDLETIVAKAIESERERRYQSADELADDLERLLSLQPIRARPASPWARATKFLRRNRSAARGLVAGSALSTLLALAALVALFLAPRWSDEHVRQARLALLDPAYANSLFSSQQFGVHSEPRRPFVPPQGRERALAAYDAALRWAPLDKGLAAERSVVAGALEHGASEALEPRLAGLAAYLEGDADVAIELWSVAERSRAPGADPDPLIEAMLGVLLLVRDEPARAYPRLREACRAFPDVGFLATYHADAALRCGDVETAERLLAEARLMPQIDPLRGLDRVTADLYAATGRLEEAETLYRSIPLQPIADLQLARLLARVGRADEALDQYVFVVSRPCSQRARAEYVVLLEQWWSRLSGAERQAGMAAAIERGVLDPRSLACRLRLARFQEPSDSPRELSFVFTTLSRMRSSPPLQSLGLPELAEVMEVDDMEHWNKIPTYSAPMKRALLAAWRSPWPAFATRVVHAHVERGAARATTAAAASVLGAIAGAQNCPNAPCFQGLGDLAGGSYYSFATCLSSDGSCVGGGSTGSLSNGPYPYEPIRWRVDTGMVSLGDLPGNWRSGYVEGLSLDGSVAAGWSSSANGNSPIWAGGVFSEAFRWTEAGGMIGVGDVTGGRFMSYAAGLSDDGSFIAGFVDEDSPWSNDARHSGTWTSATGWVVQGGSACLDSFFLGVSRNGLWAVGQRVTAPSGQGVSEAIRWSSTNGYEVIHSVPYNGPNGFIGEAVSDDGSVVVGFDGYSFYPAYQASEWTAGSGLQTLGDLPGGAAGSIALSITRDGSLIVGFGNSAAGKEAVLWDEQRTLHRLADYLECREVTIPSGWTLTSCEDVVENSGVITLCGTGTNPTGYTEAWIARCLRFPTPTSYCTAGTTTNGCNASMSASGTPSIAASSGFTLNCSNVEGQKFGLIFYGISGPKASPWAPGSTSFLCVKAPVQRTPADNSGGTTGACDGSLSIDFLAYLASHPGALGQPFAAGQCVHAQTWFRDPPAPGTTNLSNALQFVTMP